MWVLHAIGLDPCVLVDVIWKANAHVKLDDNVETIGSS